jgi:hypothetical protein
VIRSFRKNRTEIKQKLNRWLVTSATDVPAIATTAGLTTVTVVRSASATLMRVRSRQKNPRKKEKNN